MYERRTYACTHHWDPLLVQYLVMFTHTYIENFEQLENKFSFDNTTLTIKFISLHLLIMLTANIFCSFVLNAASSWLVGWLSWLSWLGCEKPNDKERHIYKQNEWYTNDTTWDHSRAMYLYVLHVLNAILFCLCFSLCFVYTIRHTSIIRIVLLKIQKWY